MTLTHTSVGAVVVRPATLTLACTMVALDDLPVNPNIAIFAFPQTSMAARENLSTSGTALEILRCHVYVARGFDRMLAPRNVSFDLFLAAHYLEIPRLVTFQACAYMAAQEDNIGHFDLAHLFAFFAAWPWTWMIAAGFRPRARLKADYSFV